MEPPVSGAEQEGRSKELGRGSGKVKKVATGVRVGCLGRSGSR